MEFLRQEVPKTSAPAAERKKNKDTIYVGIFSGSKTPSPCDWGTEAIHDELQNLKQVVAEYIRDVSAAETGFYDVIVMPNRSGSGSMPPNENWPEALRDFVQAGGGALMVHHAIGRNPPYPTLFPEVGACGEMCITVTAMQMVKEHPVTTGERKILVNSIYWLGER